MSYASDILRWLQRKRYQYEVTFSLYMMTPTEKFIFSMHAPPDNVLKRTFATRKNTYTLIDSFIFLFLSMIMIAGCLYLPEHVATMCSRAWFYYAGPDETSPTVGMTRKTTIAGAGAGIGTGSMTGTAGLEGQHVLEHLQNL